MRDDPIVEEVRKAREALSAQFNYDVDAIFADLQERQLALGSRLVAPNPKACSPTEAENPRETLSRMS